MKKTSNMIRNMVYTAMMTALIVVCTWIQIPMTVSFTMQTFAVMCAGALLGPLWGTLSVVLYLAIGAIGVPVFSGFRGGFAVLGGATGGFLIGFILTALVVGLVWFHCKNLIIRCISMIVGDIICFAFGTIWFYILYTTGGKDITIGYVLSICVIPFILPDLGKIVLSFLLSWRLEKVLHKGKKA